MSQCASLLKAISFAAQHHVDQMRKDEKTPYIAHPMRVMLVLRHVFGVEDAEVLAAGVLHDTIEDTTADRDDLIERFGERVAEYVALLSKDKRLPEEQREQTYFESLSKAPIEVKLCKLADTYDNLVDCQGLSPAQRSKTIDKATRIVTMFSEDLAGEWSNVLDAVRKCIDSVRAGD